MQFPERNAVFSPPIVGQIRIRRGIHGCGEPEARVPAQKGRGIPHTRAAAAAAAMFDQDPACAPQLPLPSWRRSRALPAADVSAGRPQPLPGAGRAAGAAPRGGPATCASRHARQRSLLRAVSSAQEHEATYLTADRKKRKRARLRLRAEVSPSGRAGLGPHSASTAPSRPAAPASWEQADKRRQNLTRTCEAAKTARFFNKGTVWLQAQFKRQKFITANETGERYSN